MANGESFVDFSSLSKTAIDLANLQERRRGNTLREQQAAVGAQKNLLEQNRLKLDATKQQIDVVDGLMNDPQTPVQLRPLLLQKKYQFAKKADPNLPVPSVEEIVGQAEFYNQFITEGLSNPTSKKFRELAGFAIATQPGFGKELFDVYKSAGTSIREFDEANQRRELNSAKLEQIEQDINTNRAREGVLSVQGAKIEADLKRMQDFQPTVDRLTKTLKGLEIDKRRGELDRLKQEDKQVAAFGQFVTGKLQELPATIQDLDAQIATLRGQITSDKSLKARAGLDAQISALELTRDTYDKQRVYLELANSLPADDPRVGQAFKAFDASHKALLREKSKASQAIDDAKNRRTAIAEGRFERDTALANQTAEAQQEFSALPDREQTRQSAARIARKHSTEAVKVPVDDVLKGLPQGLGPKDFAGLFKDQINLAAKLSGQSGIQISAGGDITIGTVKDPKALADQLEVLMLNQPSLPQAVRESMAGTIRSLRGASQSGGTPAAAPPASAPTTPEGTAIQETVDRIRESLGLGRGE